jgi:hypothetical protein
MSAALALPVDHLFVREHGPERGTPVDRNLGLEREAALEEPEEDPLRPADVGGVGRVDLARPVVREAERLQLAREDGDVRVRRLGRVRTRLDRVLSAGSPNASQPIGWSTSNPRMRE